MYVLFFLFYLCSSELSRRDNKSRVEVWRGGLGRCLCSLLARSFVCGCHIISTMLRFHTPLIKPGVQISRTRLSDKAC